MRIELPATITAVYDPELMSYDCPEGNGNGNIILSFGGYPFKWIPVSNGYKYEDDQYELECRVGLELAKLFEKAVDGV